MATISVTTYPIRKWIWEVYNLYNPKKEKPHELPAPNVFFTADHHFYHRRIIDYCKRGFKSMEEMNEFMVDRWNEVVSVHDIVYHVGDFGLGKPEKLRKIRYKLNGKIILIRGDHDYEFSKTKWLEVVGVEEVHDTLDVEEFELLHLPHREDSPFEESAAHWRLCGHVHDLWRIKGRQLNVGVDVNNYYPLSIKQIREEIREIKNV